MLNLTPFKSSQRKQNNPSQNPTLSPSSTSTHNKILTSGNQWLKNRLESVPIKRFFAKIIKTLSSSIYSLAKKITSTFRLIFPEADTQKAQKKFKLINKSIKNLKLDLGELNIKTKGKKSFDILLNLLSYKQRIIETQNALHLLSKNTHLLNTLQCKDLKKLEKDLSKIHIKFDRFIDAHIIRISKLIKRIAKKIDSSNPDGQLIFLNELKMILDFLSPYIEKTGQKNASNWLKNLLNNIEGLFSDSLNKNIQAGSEPNGIPNIGNSCYQNSCCQALFNIPYFTSLLHGKELPIPNIKDVPFKNISNEKEKLRQFNLSCENYYKHAALRENLKKFHLNWLVATEEGEEDSLMADLAEAIRTTLFENQFILGEDLDQQDAAECLGSFLNSFGFLLNTRTEISAKNARGQKNETINILSLPIQEEDASLEELLKAYQSEKINSPENKWRGHAVYNKKVTLIKEVPKVLVFQMKIFDNFGSKKFVNLRMPDTMNMNLLLDKTLKTEGKTFIYKLKSYINHTGEDLEGGHYTANVLKEKEENETWYTTNDSDVYEALNENEERGSAYIYFYELVEDSENNQK